MLDTPKSLRLHIGIFGRTNVGKSSFLNMIAGQDVAMTSSVPGTTTDVVEKSMELLPIGPVNFLDTAGFDDVSTLSAQRIERSRKIFDRADIAVIICEAGIWTKFEDELTKILKEKKIPFVIAINKIDDVAPTETFISELKNKSPRILLCSSIDGNKELRDKYIIDFKNLLLEILPTDFSTPMPLLGDLISPGGLTVMIIPIDSEAPRGRIILPQVQAIRDVLDSNAASVVVKETDYPAILDKLKVKPDLVICDSQVVDHMVRHTPEDIPCTTFSILFSRFKGDLVEEVKGAAAIANLKNKDQIIIAESCSHHPNQDDIGRVKSPRWLNNYLKHSPNISHSAGRDYPENINDYKVIIHCGACMLTRNEKLVRIEKAKQAEVPITNYGIAISMMQGVLERVLTPFPEALAAFKENIKE